MGARSEAFLRATRDALRLRSANTSVTNVSDGLFHGVRWRLTLWYSCVLAGALVISGIVLYFSVEQRILGPVRSDLKSEAGHIATIWQTSPPDLVDGSRPCPSQILSRAALVVCYAPDGSWHVGTEFAQTLRAFAQDPKITKSGSSFDTVETNRDGAFSAIERYTLTVPNVLGDGQSGVLVIGTPIGAELTTLSTLLRLLLILGGLTLLFSFLAGLFLANRALAPARLAYSRQQSFIADASHELRTPLTMIRSSLEYILRRRDALTPEQEELLRDTVDETAHLGALATNMLTLARLDSADTQIEKDLVNLTDVGGQVARWAGALARERDIAIHFESDDQVMVLADRSLLEEAVLVLVDNAIKYNTAGGSITIRVREDGRWAVLDVCDTGIGIAPEHVERLGERFYRVDRARSRESGGAGLGLSIVRSIVARHDATLQIQSAVGMGTTASITLPALDVVSGPKAPSE